MTLPSQMQRGSGVRGARTTMNSAGRSSPWAKPIAVLAIVAVVVVGLLALGKVLPFGRGAKEAKATGMQDAQVAGMAGEEARRRPTTDASKTNDLGPKPVATTPAAGVPAPAPSTGLSALVPERASEATPASQPETTKPAPVDVSNPQGEPARPALPASSPAGVPGVSPAGGVIPGTVGGAPKGTDLPVVPVVTPEQASTLESPEVLQLVSQGDLALRQNNQVEARRLYSRALLHPRTTRGEQGSLREKLTKIGEDLVFSTKVVAGDDSVEQYVVEEGDNPTKIWRRAQLATDLHLIERINKVDPKRIRVGQKLKLVRGPFHAVVGKSDYRLDVFMGSPDAPEEWVYVRSMAVGLGEGDSTPVGDFVVRRHSKLVNPHWVNPRTGERFDANDPKNPIGEHWLGLEGIGASASHTGYGLHGTIDPASIGRQMSMGCVRLRDDDISLLYDLLVEDVSIVRIRP